MRVPISMLLAWALAARFGSAREAMAMSEPLHHVDGGFQNLVPIERPGPSVTIPFFLRRAAGLWRMRPGAPPSVSNDGAFLRENARHSSPTVTWIGHSTLLVQMDHVTFLTDPIWSETPSPFSSVGPRRFAPPGLAFEALPPIDFVVISHNHYDHLDLPTLRRLAATGTRFLVPLRVGELLRSEGIDAVQDLDWWESRQLGHVEIHCVPSQHWSGRGLTDQRATLWSGWVVLGPTRRFYYAGDTGYFTGFAEIGARFGPFGLAALPIGAYEPKAMMRAVHLNPEEALQAGSDVRAEKIIGVHYGTFDLTDEPLDEPPRRFRAEASRRGTEDRSWTPPLGETRFW